MGYGNSIRVLYLILPIRWQGFNFAGVWKHRTRSWYTSSWELSQQTSSDADLQLSHCHEQLCYKPCFVEALERNRGCCIRNSENKPKWTKKSVDHQMWLLMCPRTSMQYVGKIIKLWIWFPSLLVNSQFCRSNAIESEYQTLKTNIIVHGGVDRIDQNISAYMINLRTKKWWWPLVRFVADVAVNNA